MDGIPLPLHDEDPFELVGMVLPGGPDQLKAMARALVEEYVLLGWDEKRLMTLFVNPFFLATHRLYQQLGDAYIQTLVRETWAQWRVAGEPGVGAQEVDRGN